MWTRENEVAHSNGNIFFKAQETVDEKVTEILKFAEEIQENTKSAIQDGFENFLKESQDEEREDILILMNKSMKN